MPKLYHKKSPNGCLRCKKRRVKCDEAKPICGACKRHRVSCEYPEHAPPTAADAGRPTTDAQASPAQAAPIAGDDATLAAATKQVDDAWYSTPKENALVSLECTTTPLELRLFHYWVLHTCSSFAINADYHRYRVPLMASEHRIVLDVILAVAALHLHRSTDGDTPIGRAHRAENPAIDHHAFMVGNTSREMLQISIHYLHRGIRAHRDVFANSDRENFEGIYLSSVLIALNCILLLSADEEADVSVTPFDETMWLRLGAGPRALLDVWKRLEDGRQPLEFTGVLRGGPDLTDGSYLFHPDHAKPFQIALLWAAEFESIAPEEMEAYQHTVSYIGLAYKCMKDKTESPFATSRRFIAFPSRVPPKFLDLAFLQRPRALLIMAHVMALFKLISEHIPWYVGILEKRLPAINERLPLGWRPALQWPFAIMNRAEGTLEPIPEPPTIEEFR